MKHRIAAGAIVEQDGRILLVRHHKPGVYDFWVAPGGGAEGEEDLMAAARREVREEAGIDVEIGSLAYIEELTTPDLRECKFWFVGRATTGHLCTVAPQARQEHIVEAAWLATGEFEGKIVFPPVLHTQYWQDKRRGFTSPRYLGVRRMEFW